MTARLFVPALGERGSLVDLPAEEAGHLQRVLRVKPGASVRLFDGRGREVAARVSLVQRDRVAAEIGDAVDAAPEWAVRVTLAQAILKGDKIDEVVRDAVMMGVAAIQPMMTVRAEVPAGTATRGRRVDRWRRIAVSSAKQCGRAVVPDIQAPLPLGAVLDSAPAAAMKLLLVEPSSDASVPRSPLPVEAPASLLVLVGPEGGWTDGEVALAQSAGCVPISLGPRTLRADIAAVVALSVLQHVWAKTEDASSSQ